MSSTNFLLLGKTGSGKSSLGNALLGRQSPGHFAVSSGMFSTPSREFKSGTSEGQTVVDSPDILEYHNDPRGYRKSVSKAFDLVNGEFHIFLILIRMDVRFTSEERSVLEILSKLFGQRVFEFAIVVFTHCDSLLASGDRNDFDAVLRHNRSEMESFDKLLIDCGNRCCPIGKDKSDEAMKPLRELVSKLKVGVNGVYSKSDFESTPTSKKTGPSAHSSTRACAVL